MMRRLFGTEGWGAATGVMLLVGFGVFVLFVSLADLREAARVKPEVRSCEAWLQDPSGARWVTLTGCKLDLSAAASRKWKGWISVRDGGTSGARFLELYIPIAAHVGDALPPKGVLATTDAKLLALVDGMDGIKPEDVEAYLSAHEAEFQTLLNPPDLTGYVEPLKSMSSRTALGELAAADAVVLEQGREPARANSLFGLVVGLVCIALGVRSVGRRLLIDRDSSL